MADEAERFFFDTDNDCHWYRVPAARRTEWEAWVDLSSGDERSWDVPDYAKRLGGHPNAITFTDPRDG